MLSEVRFNGDSEAFVHPSYGGSGAAAAAMFSEYQNGFDSTREEDYLRQHLECNQDTQMPSLPRQGLGYGIDEEEEEEGLPPQAFPRMGHHNIDPHFLHQQQQQQQPSWLGLQDTGLGYGLDAVWQTPVEQHFQSHLPSLSPNTSLQHHDPMQTAGIAEILPQTLQGSTEMPTHLLFHAVPMTHDGQVADLDGLCGNLNLCFHGEMHPSLAAAMGFPIEPWFPTSQPPPTAGETECSDDDRKEESLELPPLEQCNEDEVPIGGDSPRKVPSKHRLPAVGATTWESGKSGGSNRSGNKAVIRQNMGKTAAAAKREGGSSKDRAASAATTTRPRTLGAAAAAAASGGGGGGGGGGARSGARPLPAPGPAASEARPQTSKTEECRPRKDGASATRAATAVPSARGSGSGMSNTTSKKAPAAANLKSLRKPGTGTAYSMESPASAASMTHEASQEADEETNNEDLVQSSSGKTSRSLKGIARSTRRKIREGPANNDGDGTTDGGTVVGPVNSRDDVDFDETVEESEANEEEPAEEPKKERRPNQKVAEKRTASKPVEPEQDLFVFSTPLGTPTLGRVPANALRQPRDPTPTPKHLGAQVQLPDLWASLKVDLNKAAHVVPKSARQHHSTSTQKPAASLTRQQGIPRSARGGSSSGSKSHHDRSVASLASQSDYRNVPAGAGGSSTWSLGRVSTEKVSREVGIPLLVPGARERERQKLASREEGWDHSFVFGGEASSSSSCSGTTKVKPPPPLVPRSIARALASHVMNLQTLPPQASAGYGDWYNSNLNEIYVGAMQQEQGAAPREFLSRVLVGRHATLRDVIEAEEPDAQTVMLSLEPLWDELQVPTSVRESWQQSYDVAALCRHAKSLLAFRDATLLVINGLQEHERLVACLRQKDSDTIGSTGASGGAAATAASPTSASSLPSSSSSRASLMAQLQRVDTAVTKFITTWSRHFMVPPWLDEAAAPGSNAVHPPAIFIWRGVDALAQLRLDGADLAHREAGSGAGAGGGGAESRGQGGGSGSQPWEALFRTPGDGSSSMLARELSASLLGDRHKDYNASQNSLAASSGSGFPLSPSRVGGPQNSSKRAALNDARALRSLLRSGGTSGQLAKLGSSCTRLAPGCGGPD